MQNQTTMQKENNLKPHQEAKKTMQNHTTKQKKCKTTLLGKKKGMENHTKMQSHATMKTKYEKKIILIYNQLQK